jgi:hypothetical protein
VLGKGFVTSCRISMVGPVFDPTNFCQDGMIATLARPNKTFCHIDFGKFHSMAPGCVGVILQVDHSPRIM